jgi:hypothetical protein
VKKRSGSYVLIVGDAPDAALVEEALAAGTEVRRCPGPPVAECPVAAGRRCPLRKGARATIVYLDRRQYDFPTLPCLAYDAPPTVGVVGDTTLPLHASDGYALVGSKKGALGVLEALAAAIETKDTNLRGREQDDE